MSPLPLPLTRADVEGHGERCVSAWKFAAAARLYERLVRRPVVLTRAVPMGIKQVLAQRLHQDGLVLVAVVYVDGSGRRFTCRAQAFTPRAWWEASSSWMAFPLPSRRLCFAQVLWPAPDTATWRDRFADLAF